MVAPSVPGSLLTPIAPQSLSFRPLVVPESSAIEIRLPYSSRSHARSVAPVVEYDDVAGCGQCGYASASCWLDSWPT